VWLGKRSACPGTLLRQSCSVNLTSQLRQFLGDAIVADDEQTLAEHSGDKGVRFDSRAWIVTARRSS